MSEEVAEQGKRRLNLELSIVFHPVALTLAERRGIVTGNRVCPQAWCFLDRADTADDAKFAPNMSRGGVVRQRIPSLRCPACGRVPSGPTREENAGWGRRDGRGLGTG
jgi:hypothetical protein